MPDFEDIYKQFTAKGVTIVSEERAKTIHDKIQDFNQRGLDPFQSIENNYTNQDAFFHYYTIGYLTGYFHDCIKAGENVCKSCKNDHGSINTHPCPLNERFQCNCCKKCIESCKKHIQL